MKKKVFKRKEIVMVNISLLLFLILLLLVYLNSVFVYGKKALIVIILLYSIFSLFFLFVSFIFLFRLIKEKVFKVDMFIFGLIFLIFSILFIIGIINPYRDLFNDTVELVIDDYKIDWDYTRKVGIKYYLVIDEDKFRIDKNVYYKLDDYVVKPKLIIRYWDLSGVLECVDVIKHWKGWNIDESINYGC